ncbi:hypothetical protein DAPPUDRAFT_115996 [Daphnia pulex]|uniref:Reverse transcriptase zinc-binding domain-containing protein n=1 Tax=Daphnia pulex TaxID=6669 RepID=E9HN79_DAPPU|nr:hypothetical protein DAPPUDRAFT_115996 [Daphnia pulex]|eukprot:EFX66805.1 hypothetical protein DAPPUDRAFT_115996 [Daphnia pulex]
MVNVSTSDKNYSSTVFKSPQLFKPVGNVDVIANMQFIKDQLIDYSNDLVRVIETLQCDSRKAMHERVISTAQYNGWLAASMVSLPKCTKHTAYGKTALAISCKANEVDFSVELSACGPQPKYKNFTINRDGWELVTFTPCYWTTGFVNFNDKPYGYRNKTWYPIEAKIVVPQQTLAHSFRYDEVRYFDYLHQTNPAYNKMVLDSMNVLAEIVATINDHSSGNFSSSHVPRKNNVLIAAPDISDYPKGTRSHRLDSTMDQNCQFCQKDPETDKHLKIHCHLRQPLWSWLEETVRRLIVCRTNTDDIIRGHIGPTENLRIIFTLVATYIFTTWKERSHQRIPRKEEVENL